MARVYVAANSIYINTRARALSVLRRGEKATPDGERKAGEAHYCGGERLGEENKTEERDLIRFTLPRYAA